MIATATDPDVRAAVGRLSPRQRQLLDGVLRGLSALDAGAELGIPQSTAAREREIAAAIAEGLSNRAIAERLCMSESTVKNAISVIRVKLRIPYDHNIRVMIARWVWDQQQGQER